MFRALVKNLKNVAVGDKFLSPSISSISVLKRFGFTDMLENVKKTEDSKFDELKKYRQAEVCIRFKSFQSHVIKLIYNKFEHFQVHLWHALGHQCVDPSELTEEHWQHLYELDTKHQRKRFCRFLLLKKQAKAEKKERAAEEREAKKGNRERIRAERDANPHIVYGLGHNSIHLRINTQTMNKWINIK